MAINDNTSYELFGYQVKDLATKIKSKAEAASLAPVATSGLYSDLTGKPTIPTVYNGTLTVTQNGTTAGTFTANSSTDTTIALTDTTYSAFTGTDGQTAGTAGLVPAPATTDAGKFLKADGTWDTAGGGSWAGQKVFYGTSTTGQFYNDRDVATSNDFVLETGTVLIVKFSYANNSSIIYLTVNNDASTRKQVMQGGAVPSGKVWKNNEAVTFVYDGTYWQLQKGEANTTTYGIVKLGSGYTSQDPYTVPSNAQLYDVYTIADGKKEAVTYYATSDNTQGFPTYYTYLYSDSARTTVVTPDTILNNFENGNTVLIEYESTQTGSSAYKMTLAVETVAKVGADGYRMNVSEINVAAGDYNQVETQLMATWDGQSSFNGRWVLVRNQMPVVNNGTLTIQQNGTTKGTFTANQSSATTVNIGTITAETVAPAQQVGAITASMIDWTTMFVPENITIAFAGNSRTAKRFKINATTYAIAYHGSTGLNTGGNTTRQITITYPQLTNIFCAFVKYTVSGQTTPATGHSNFGATSADTYVSPIETSGSAVNVDLLIIAEMSS